MTDGYTCPGCAAHSDDFPECWHTPNEWALAEAMRDAVERLHPNASPGWENGSVESARYFVQDAEGVAGRCGEPPYVVVMTHPTGSQYAAVGVVNGRHLFGSNGEDGESYADYLGDLGGFLVPAEVSS